MLIVIKLFAEDQSALDSPELDSPMSSSSELEEEPEESESDDESLLGADTSERTPSVSGSESESEGAKSEPEAASVFRLFTSLSFRLPRKLRTCRTFRNSAATPDTSYLVHCGESRAMMSNCSIISMFQERRSCRLILFRGFTVSVHVSVPLKTP